MVEYFEHCARMEQQREAEASGRVADSLDVRVALIKRMHAGELTLDEVQSEVKRLKRNAKKNGQITRNQAYLGR
jgi:hypothetical protein